MFRKRKYNVGRSFLEVGFRRLRRYEQKRILSSSQQSIKTDDQSPHPTVHPSSIINSNWRLGIVRRSQWSVLQPHLNNPQEALCEPRHRRVHKPRREHVAEAQACLKAAVRHRSQAAPDLSRRVHVASTLQDDPFCHIVEKYTPN